MPAPYDGGCQCGRVRYRISAEPDTVYICHCSECQKQSASAFGMSMTLAANAIDVTEGTPKTFRRSAASGNEVTCTFCPECGTRLFHATTGRPGKVNVKPGTLDDRADLDPVAHVWTDSAQPWVTIPPDVLAFGRQPDSHQVLIDAYQKRRSA